MMIVVEVSSMARVTLLAANQVLPPPVGTRRQKYGMSAGKPGSGWYSFIRVGPRRIRPEVGTIDVVREILAQASRDAGDERLGIGQFSGRGCYPVPSLQVFDEVQGLALQVSGQCTGVCVDRFGQSHVPAPVGNTDKMGSWRSAFRYLPRVSRIGIVGSLRSRE